MPRTVTIPCAVCGCESVAITSCWKNRLQNIVQVIASGMTDNRFNGIFNIPFNPSAVGGVNDINWGPVTVATNRTVSATLQIQTTGAPGRPAGCYWIVYFTNTFSGCVCSVRLLGSTGVPNYASETNAVFSQIIDDDAWGCNQLGCALMDTEPSVSIGPATGDYTGCCPSRDLPDTLKVTFADPTGVSCLNDVTFNIVYDYAYQHVPVLTECCPRSYYHGIYTTGCAGCDPLDFYWWCNGGIFPMPPTHAEWIGSFSDPLTVGHGLYGPAFVQCHPFLAQFLMPSPCAGESGITLTATITEP